MNGTTMQKIFVRGDELKNRNMAAGVTGGVIGAAVGRIATKELHPEDYKMYNDVIDSYISTIADPKYRSKPQYLALP